MAITSYGSITIVDITDIGEFSVYPTANNPRTQIYNPDTSRYVPDWSIKDPDSALYVTPVAYYAGKDVSTVAQYSWKRKDGAGTETNLEANETVITKSGNTGVLKVDNNVLGLSNTKIITYVVTASYTVDNVPLTAKGEISFALTTQGGTAKTATITGENIFKYNTNGALVPTGKTITLDGKVSGVSIVSWQYKNGTSWSTYPGSTAGSNSLVVRDTDNVFTNDSAVIRLNTNDNTVYDLITITKLRDGAPGEKTVTSILTNEDQMLPANAQGEITSFSGATTEFKIYEGGTDVTSTWTITKTSHGVTDSESLVTKATITAMTGDVGDVTFSASKTGYDPIEKKFSLVKVKTGQSGVSPTIYSLEPSTVVVNTLPVSGAIHPNPNPASVTFNAYQQVGTTKTPYTGRIQFYKNGSTLIEEVTTDSSTRTINFNNDPWNKSEIESIKAVLYEAGANTHQLDTQTIVIVCDGAQGSPGNDGKPGVGAANVILGNEADVIPCTSNNNPIPNGTGIDSDKFIIRIPYQGYQGTTARNTGVNASAIPVTDTGLSTPINADTSSEPGVILYKIPNTARLVENGAIAITFSVNVINQNETAGTVSISKVYTWTRSSAAIDAENARVLLINAEDGTIFVNSTGTLYAKGILYDGAGEASNETYTWYQYKNGNYVAINSTATPGVKTGHRSSTGWTDYNNGSTNSDMIKIEASAIDGYASFKVVSLYDGVSYEQYISFIDKSDPLQVTLHSTVGTQIKNNQGEGCIYARVTQGDTELDTVPQDLQVGTSLPSPVLNKYFVLLSQEALSKNRTAKLYKCNGTDWIAVTSSCKYEWFFRDSNNNPITDGKVPYQNTTDKTQNKFIYINADLIDSKITVDCKVTT